MENPADSGELPAAQSSLRNDLEATIRKMTGRPDDASIVQQLSDLEESILELNIVTTDRAAFVQFFVQRDNQRIPSGQPAQIDLRNLKVLIMGIRPEVMNRVFKVVLNLGSGHLGRDDLPLDLLPTIRRSITARGFTLHLHAKDTPIEALTSNPAVPDKLAKLPGVTLEKLTLDYACAIDNKNLRDIIGYTATGEMPSAIVVDLRLRGIGASTAAQVSIAGLVASFPQMTSLHLNYNGGPASASHQDPTFLDLAEWQQLATLKQLKQLEVIAYFDERDFCTLPPLEVKLPFLETLVLENVEPRSRFFSKVPRLTTLRIQHDKLDALPAGRSKRFTTSTIREVVTAIQSGRLKALETFCISASGEHDVNTMGGHDIMRDLSKAIVEDNFQHNCPKLRTLVFDFDYRMEGGQDERTILNLLKVSGGRFLAKAPLTIEFPRAVLNLPQLDHITSKTYEDALSGAVGKLARAVHKSGLQCLKLGLKMDYYDWDGDRMEHPIHRSKLNDILRRFKEDQQRQPEPPTQELELEIVKAQAPDNDIPDNEGKVETVRIIVWRRPNGFMHRIVLTNRGPPEPQPTAGSGPIAGDGQGGAQPGAAAAGLNDQGKQ